MTDSKIKKFKIEYQIKGVEILDFGLKHSQEPVLPSTVYHFNINVQHKINPEMKLVFVIVSVNVMHEDKKTLLGNINASCIFHIANFDDLKSKKDDKSIVFPQETIDMFNSIAISTTRGLMFNCFRGTFLHNAILPIVDPKGFKQEKIITK
ncbi:MAG TPA: hypothetical protein DCG75_02615 [Bacteroidales bacterium]|nr:hypothetical protein [Bacteroidales bacterium]